MNDEDDGPGMSPTTSRAPAEERPRHPRRPANQSGPTLKRGAEASLRLPFIQTNGKQVFLYDYDIAGVVSVSTDKHGACLILRVRDGEDVWITDIDRHRWLLNMASNVEVAELLAQRGRPRG